ncbi:LysR substrate-binding domain-containing protein [Chitinilyticum litopenaei]|uniref:LysR substrate-binding domain-containing protein n=1 Tax=Chitinilyticum litopenaei TaxID=1121276 RepID=UPI000410E4C9|nr:LysR substrate-binding domain-containing protein [Chitinilyticum litopenaei]
MDKLRSMQVFVTVADCGSFSAAAVQLGISAVMVGKYIQQLEQQLGSRLLERSTRRQSLSEAGKAYCAHARQVLELVEAGEAAVASLQDSPRGLLRISAPVTLGGVAIAPLLAGYLVRYPQVQVELMLSNQRVDLIEDGFDLAIRIGPAPQELVARALPPYQLAIAAAPAYLARHGTPQEPAELADHHCLTHRIWGQREGWPGLLMADGREWPAPSRLACNDGQALRQAALAGAGIVFQPLVLLAADLACGALVPVLSGHWPAPRPCHLVYLPDHRPRPRLHSLVDYLLAALNGQGIAAEPDD